MSVTGPSLGGGSGSWSPVLVTLAILTGLPFLQVGLVYKRLRYSKLTAALPAGWRANCSCGCYDGFLEGRAYYSQGQAHFYSSVYRHVYINSEPQAALLLSLMACSVLLLYRALDCLWRLAGWRRIVVVALVVNLLLAYDLFWATFQAGNSGKVTAAVHCGAFYGLQCCLCWALIGLSECHRLPAPLALNWAALLTFGPLLIQVTNLATLLQYVSRQVFLRDYGSALGHALGHAFTAAALARLPAAEWKLLLGSSRLLSLDAVCLAGMWIFNILS